MTGALTWLGVALCGGLGAVARFQVSAAVSARVPSRFPFGTLVVNLSGTLVLGVLVGAAVTDRAALLAGTGFLGGYTTFSTWMVETERLREDGDLVGVVGNLVAPTLLGLGAAGLGFAVGRALA